MEYTTAVADMRSVSADDHASMQRELDRLLSTMAEKGWNLEALTSVPISHGTRILHTMVFSRAIQ